MSRYFAFFALLALAAAYPASDDVPRPITTITDSDFEDPSPWFRFPPFGNIFAPLTKLFSSFADIGPRIEIDDDKFRVIVNVKEYKKEDLKVKVKGDFILVQGAHEAKHDDHDLFASQFFHTYSLPLNASASDVTATLTSDGYLDVIAPINGADENEKAAEREVPIVESGKPLKEEKEPVVPAPAVPVENADNVANFDKVETFDTPINTPIEPLAKVETVDKVENEPSATVDKVDVEPTATVEKVENDKPIAPVETVENIESIPPADKVENFEKVEPLPVTTQAAEVEAEKEVTPAPAQEEVPVQDIKVPQDNELNEIQP
ncbi:heat shock protein 67B1-like isoform X2 [Maniola jurtina]|uniref:heat shock protein 67B1-like isoform X2 n=1 Tax=Maniola jurtina TaxID=191418 RepID=UPI001E68E6D2|nr:heat shock protein 67B1-like isoform X2 [Maniola jurtina]